MSFSVKANVVQCGLVFMARSAFQLDTASLHIQHISFEVNIHFSCCLFSPNTSDIVFTISIFAQMN